MMDPWLDFVDVVVFGAKKVEKTYEIPQKRSLTFHKKGPFWA